jgi:hypothetical protein
MLRTLMPPTPDTRRRVLRLALFALAIVGAMVGVAILLRQLAFDPLADTRAYYEAGTRLNAGLPLYPADADPNAPEFYRYPPLLAIAFRPLALLPYPVAALIWGAVVVASFAATLWRLGLRRRDVWLAVGILGFPIGYTLAVAQAHAPVTLLLTLGSPWAVALAANIKLFPLLAGAWFVGRRDWRSVRTLLIWMAGLAGIQLVLEPQASIDFLGTLTLEQVGDVRNLSPYAVSPLLWVGLVVAGGVLALRLAPSRWGWVAAVGLATLTPPRLSVYMLMGLLAALRTDRFGRASR